MTNDAPAFELDAARLAQLRALVPEAFSEGRLEAGRLLQALGLAPDGPEHYGLSWVGKAEAVRAAHTPAGGALTPRPEDSVSFESARHVVIEGDNLEVLKHLQAAYAEQVRLIVIDPPYNTGGDFVYPDDYRDGLAAYLALSGQAAAGRRLATLPETDGRFHSRWLSMMYPRLWLARRLLARDGFLFVTIDDHEVHTLRMLLGEIFGEENFVAHVVWQKKYTRSNDARFFSATHDHVLVFAKDKAAATLNLLPRSEAQARAYANPDGDPRGPWKATPLHARSGTLKDFRYTFENGVSWSPPAGTYPRYAAETLARLEAEGAIWFGADGQAVPCRKTYLSEVKAGVTPVTIWPHDEVGHTHEANQELKDVLGEGVFDTPKPTRLIRRMLALATRPDREDLVLDFFAGSGTTGHAVLAQNAADGGNRRFVLVQLPEPTGDARFANLAEITRARIQRVLPPGEGVRAFALGPSAPAIGELEGVFALAIRFGKRLDTPVEALAYAGATFYRVEDVMVTLAAEVPDAAWAHVWDARPRMVVATARAFGGDEARRANVALGARAAGVSLWVE